MISYARIPSKRALLSKCPVLVWELQVLTEFIDLLVSFSIETFLLPIILSVMRWELLNDDLLVSRGYRELLEEENEDDRRQKIWI